MALLLASAAAVRLPTLAQPLLERHGFRQTQTAYTGLVMHEEGIDLFHPKLPILGERGEVPFEFPLFQAFGALLMDVGLASDVAMRLAGLLCFLATAVCLWGLVRELAGRLAGVLACAAFLASPFGLLWGRGSLIEYLATAGAVGAAWAALRWRRTGVPVAYVAAIALGMVAFLVKPTTALFWTLPILLGLRLRPRTLALVAIPLLAGVAWTLHADAVKGSDPATAFLTSGEVRYLQFGTLEQRLDLDHWHRILWNAGAYVIGLPFVPLAFVGAVVAWRSRLRQVWLGIGLAALTPILVFFELYQQHDYYLAAISPALSAFVGVGGAALVAARPGPAARRRDALATCAGLLVSLGLAGDYWTLAYRPVVDVDGVLPRAAELRAATAPADRVVVFGRTYSAELLYYARRRGQMIANELATYEFVGGLPAKGYRVVLVWEPAADAPILTRAWTWSGALSRHVLVVGDRPADLRGAILIGTDDRDVVADLEGAPRLAGPLLIVCGAAPVNVTGGSRGTWFLLTSPVGGTARLSVGTDGGALAARTAMFIASAVGVVPAVSCSGADAVLIDRVVDAGLPR